MGTAGETALHIDCDETEFRAAGHKSQEEGGVGRVSPEALTLSRVEWGGNLESRKAVVIDRTVEIIHADGFDIAAYAQGNLALAVEQEEARSARLVECQTLAGVEHGDVVGIGIVEFSSKYNGPLRHMDSVAVDFCLRLGRNGQRCGSYECCGK